MSHLFVQTACACPDSWVFVASRTVSLPLSMGLSSVLPPLIPWPIQRLLAAQPITGKRWVLWRLRCHTGVCTEAEHQLRQSCLSAWVSCVMGGCPVRPFFCSIAVDPRILTSGWYTNPTFLNSRYGFSTLLSPYPQY